MMEAKKRLFEEVSRHLLQDIKPSLYLSDMVKYKSFEEYPFSLLTALKETPQSPKHHPEGNVWNHTMLVVDAAARVRDKSSNEHIFMWAALLHDIGKPGTTKIRKERITAYNHDKLGATLSKQFLNGVDCDLEFIDKVVSLVRWHMQILYVNKSLPFADIKTMRGEANIEDVALLGLCDRLGRTGAQQREEEENIKIFLAKAKGNGQ
jgi:putative nucleotidyltransferase with HDIG domain